MVKEKISESELKELREEVLNATSGTKEKEAKIVFDGRQYSIRFPKRFIEEGEIDIEKDFFKIILKIPEYESNEKPKISAELVRREK